MKIALVTFDGFTDIDLFLPWDLLNRVRLEAGVSDWEVKIIGTKSHHVSAAGLVVPTSGCIQETVDADAVIFGSGSGAIFSLLEGSSYIEQFSLDPEKQLIGSMCSGAVFLGALGLLKQEKATTYPLARVRAALKNYGADIVNESFVVTQSGRVATAAGCLAAIQLSGWIIRTLTTPQVEQVVLESVQPVCESTN